jgi:hypothetical protein
MNGHSSHCRNGAPMESNAEKRSEDRQNCDAVIEWAYFNREDYFNARMLNFSRGGSYFVSSQPLIPGATVLIRLRDFESAGREACDRCALRTTALGEIKWCRELSDVPPVRFGIGVRYHFPV